MNDLINLENIGNPEILEKITNWIEIKNHVKIEYKKEMMGKCIYI